MPTSSEITSLSNKARAFVNSLSALPKKELVTTVTGQYAENYNTLRGLVHSACPEIEQYLPPIVEIVPGASRILISRSTHVEILTYCRELGSLLANVIPSEN